jgi:hypothetical protein
MLRANLGEMNERNYAQEQDNRNYTLEPSQDSTGDNYQHNDHYNYDNEDEYNPGDAQA